MKLLKVVVLVALMLLVAHAQERSMAVATYALNGPVRTFRVEVATFVSRDGDYVEGARVAQNVDAHGNWTKLTRWQTDSQGTRPLSVAYRTLTYY